VKCWREGCEEPAAMVPCTGHPVCEEHSPPRNPTPDPARTAAALREAAGMPVREVTHATVRPENLLEWRRRTWQAVKQLASAGERFTEKDVLEIVGPSPSGSPIQLIIGLLMTAAYDQQRIVHLATGEWWSIEAHHASLRAHPEQPSLTPAEVEKQLGQ
jgi:hypothetical protein